MKSKKSFFRTVEPYLYLVPVMILFILFVFWPFVKTIQLSFARTTPLGQVAQYVGLDNYTNIFTDGTFLNSLVTTLKFSVMRVILSIVLGFILAIISTEKIRAKGFFRTVYALPMAISAAAASVVFMFIFHSSLGILNRALGTHIGWLTDKKYALIAVTIVSVWMAIGMNFIYLTAAIQSVPAELYESVALDGANFFQKHRHVTIPSISPTLFFLLIINVINSVQAYAEFKMMTQGGPAESTNVIVYEIYQEAFINSRFGVACSESVILFVILIILTALQFRLEKEGDLLMKEKPYVKVAMYALNIIFAIIIIVPVIYCFNVSMMDLKEIYGGKFWPSHLTIENYTRAFQLAPFFTFIKNSLIVSGVITFAQVVTGALAAYAFAMMEFKGKKVLFYIMLATMMIPSQAIIIANYLTIADWGIRNTYAALILPNAAAAFAVFNMRQAFLTLPKEIHEAAEIDGCTNFKFLYTIGVPLIKPSLGALIIYVFLQSWNYYLWPLLVTDSVNMRTVQIGLGMLQGAEATDFRPVMAGAMVILIPSILVFIIGQKQMISGLTAGAVKG